MVSSGSSWRRFSRIIGFGNALFDAIGRRRTTDLYARWFLIALERAIRLLFLAKSIAGLSAGTVRRAQIGVADHRTLVMG